MRGCPLLCPGEPPFAQCTSKAEKTTERARNPVVMEVLRQLSVLSESDMVKLEKYFQNEIVNHAGKIVGKIQTNFKLIFNR